MKKFVLLLLLILYSSNAFSMSVKTLYEICKPYHSSGFKDNNNGATVCIGYVSGLVHAGFENCESIRGELSRLRPLKGHPDIDPQIRVLNYFSQYISNKYIEDSHIVVKEFINWVEKNMSAISASWHLSSAVSYRWEFIGKPFHCDLDKYNK